MSINFFKTIKNGLASVILWWVDFKYTQSEINKGHKKRNLLRLKFLKILNIKK